MLLIRICLSPTAYVTGDDEHADAWHSIQFEEHG